MVFELKIYLFPIFCKILSPQVQAKHLIIYIYMIFNMYQSHHSTSFFDQKIYEIATSF